MKRILLIASSLMLLSFVGYTQPVSCDLLVADGDITNPDGSPLDANQISVNQVCKVKVSIANFVSGVDAPGGHFRLKIGLGEKFVLNPGFNLSTAPLSDYFTWSYDASTAQGQITGLSKIGVPLPDQFYGTAEFLIKAQGPTTSVISFNLLINNPQGTTTTLSDPQYANNTASNTYTVTSVILPVSFLSLDVVGKDCNIAATWKVGQELNVARYEVEISKDAQTYVKAAEQPALAQLGYNRSFALAEANRWPIVFVRVKAVDKDGSFKYSEVKSVTQACSKTGKWFVSAYPNPVIQTKQITITAKEGIFNGKYKLTLMDNAGKIYKVQDVQLTNQANFKFDLANAMAGGKYLITIINGDGSQSAVLEFQKL